MIECEDKLLKTEEVAQRLRISIRGVWRLVADGQLKRAVKVGHFSMWFESDLAAYLCGLKQKREGVSR